MAVHPNMNAPVRGSTPAQQNAQGIDIEAWTEQATESLRIVSVSSSGGPRGTSVNLAIPLDEHTAPARVQDRVAVDSSNVKDAQATYILRREPLRRDSLKRREALLKGKEGSRRRQRWENGQFLPHYWNDAV